MAESTPRVLRDLRVLRPEPRGVVLYGDPVVSYPVRSIVDMPQREVLRLLELDNPPAGTELSVAEHSERLGESLKLLCPTLTDAVLADMPYRTRLDFFQATLSSEPPPLVETLGRMLDGRDKPCAEACDHGDCPPLRDLWALREKLEGGARPTVPAPPTVPGDNSGASASLTT